MRTTPLRLALLALLAGAAVTAAPASAAEGGECTLSGTAKFTQGPAAASHAFTYTFTGTLTDCRSNTAGVPTAGSIATLTPAKGDGTCGSNSTAGTALVTWADKTTSVVQYTTRSATAGVLLQGSVVPSAKVGAKTVKTTRYAGYGAAGLLVFQASPAECAGSGVTTSPINGTVGLGTS